MLCSHRAIRGAKPILMLNGGLRKQIYYKQTTYRFALQTKMHKRVEQCITMLTLALFVALISSLTSSNCHYSGDTHGALVLSSAGVSGGLVVEECREC